MARRLLARPVRAAALAAVLLVALAGCGPRGEAGGAPAEALSARAAPVRDGLDRAVDAGAEQVGVLLQIVELWRRIAELTVKLGWLLPA